MRSEESIKIMTCRSRPMFSLRGVSGAGLRSQQTRPSSAGDAYSCFVPDLCCAGGSTISIVAVLGPVLSAPLRQILYPELRNPELLIVQHGVRRRGNVSPWDSLIRDDLPQYRSTFVNWIKSPAGRQYFFSEFGRGRPRSTG